MMRNSALPGDKAALRRSARKISSGTDFTLASRLIADQIGSLPEFATARHVLLYLAMPSELNVEAVIKCDYPPPSKIWYVPRCARDGRLAVHPYVPGVTPMRSGPFGIREPDGDLVAEAEPLVIDLILVPGLLFTSNGDRLGHGGGYYDRLLPALSGSCMKIGIVCDSHVVDSLPQDPWDALVDVVVTPTRVFRR